MQKEKIEKRFLKDEAQVRVLALTIIGIAISSILALPAYQYVFNLLFLKTQGTPSLSIFFVLNAIIVPIYCWAASIAFHPKRLINPFYIQIASAGIVQIWLFVANARTFTSMQLFITEFLGSIILTFIIAVVVFVGSGFLQLLFVRWLVGLTGTIDDLDRKTFVVDANFQTVSDILLSDSFLHGFNLEHRKITAELLEVYSSSWALWQLRLVLSPSEEPNKSILATVAFEKSSYTIFYSKEVLDFRDDMIRRIEFIIGKEKLKPTSFNNTVSSMALKSALRVTNPKTIASRQELGEVPKFYRTILILMALITSAVTALFGFGIIPLDFFATTIVMIILALIVELGPRIKEILDSKK